MNNPTTFGEDSYGELYVATFDKIYQISACGIELNAGFKVENGSVLYAQIDGYQ